MAENHSGELIDPVIENISLNPEVFDASMLIVKLFFDKV